MRTLEGSILSPSFRSGASQRGDQAYAISRLKNKNASCQEYSRAYKAIHKKGSGFLLMPIILIMARQPRLNILAAFYHAMLRGNGDQSIFQYDDDWHP